jgi:hypothetical protein
MEHKNGILRLVGVSAVATSAMLVSLSLGVPAMLSAHTEVDACQNVGMACNPDRICNLNGVKTNYPGCTCDINNICAQVC